MGRQRHCAGLQDKGHGRELAAPGFCLTLHSRPKIFQIGDVGAIKLGHVGHIEPGPGHVPGGHLVKPGARLNLDRAELAEINLGYLGHAVASSSPAAL